jgi:DNA polymerase-3 subunit alpha
MAATFHDLPEALDNTGLIVDKVETLKLKKDILLPNFQLPEGFATRMNTCSTSPIKVRSAAIKRL